MLFLVAIAMIYAATGTVNLAQLAIRLPEIDPGVALVLQVLLLLAFAIKAAIFPLSAWLPDSYPTAPAPVTAVFAGLLTKVGVYAIIRTQTLLFPDGRLDDALMWAALATMVIGILGAVAQDDIKRLLSFTLVSHIGFMVFGVALATDLGYTAAIYYVAHHITVQTALFLVVGLVERAGGSTSLTKLGGLAKLTPVLAILFFVPAMNLAGIPPLSGFLGKIGLLEAGVQMGTPLAYVLVVGSVVTSLLTLYALVKAWNKAFWQTPEEPRPPVRLPFGMVAPTAALVVVGLLLTVARRPAVRLHRARRRLADRAQRRTSTPCCPTASAARACPTTWRRTTDEPAPAPAPVAHPVGDDRLADRRLGPPVGRPVRRQRAVRRSCIALAVTSRPADGAHRVPRADPPRRASCGCSAASRPTWCGRRSRSASSRCARGTCRTVP